MPFFIYQKFTIFVQMKVIFLDNDGVICLSNNFGSRYKKIKKLGMSNGHMIVNCMPVDVRFDNFDPKAIGILNSILIETGADYVVSSDWRFHATLEEIGEYYLSQGVIKMPIGYTVLNPRPEREYFSYETDLEEDRAAEILLWLKENPIVTNWVAIDDLDMSERFDHDGNKQWGLSNFVHTKISSEGIKQTGIKEKVIKFLI